MANTVYDAAFYAAQGDESLASARAVLPQILATLHPARLVDIGCGIGTWLAAAAESGIPDFLGVDGAYVDRAALRIPPDHFLPDDLAEPGLPARIAARHPGRFDVALCLEVAEHLPHTRAASFVAELCALADAVVFSAALPFQYGTDHINEQWPEYWAILFRGQGFQCFDPWRDALWNQPHLAWWYAQNLLVFARAGSQAAAALTHPADAAPLARIHPLCWLSGTLNLWRPHRAAARAEEPADYRALRDAWRAGATTLPPLQAIARARACPDAPDIFPATRTTIADPEALLATAAREAAAEAAATQMAAHEAAWQAAHATEAQLTAQRAEAAEAAATQMAAHEAARQAAHATEARLTAALAAAESARQRLEAANATLRGQIQQADARLADLARHAREAEAARLSLATALAERDEARHRLTAIRHSTSWRLTAPLRRLRGWREPD